MNFSDTRSIDIVLRLFVFLTSLTFAAGASALDADFSDYLPIADGADSSISYKLRFRSTELTPTVDKTQHLAADGHLLFLEHESTLFHVVNSDDNTDSFVCPLDFAETGPTASLNSVGYDSAGNMFVTSRSARGESSFMLYHIVFDAASRSIRAERAFSLSKESDWFQFVPAVHGNLADGDFCVVSAVRQGSASYPPQCQMLVRWTLTDGMESARSAVAFTTSIAHLQPVDSEHIVIDDWADEYYDDNYPSAPTLYRWPEGSSVIEKIASIGIDDYDSDSGLDQNRHGATFRIFSCANRDFLLYCVDGLRAVYRLAVLRGMPGSLEIGQTLWTFPAGGDGPGSYPSEPTDEFMFPTVCVVPAESAGDFRISIAGTDRYMLYDFEAEGIAEIAPSVDALQCTLAQARDENSLPLFDLRLNCRLTDEGAGRIAQSGLSIDRLTLIASSGDVAERLNASSADGAPRFSEGDFMLTDGERSFLRHAFGAEIVPDADMLSALASAEGLDFMWTDIDPAYGSYALSVYIASSDTDALLAAGLHQGDEAVLDSFEMPAAASISIGAPTVEKITLGQSSLTRYSELNSIGLRIDTHAGHAGRIDRGWDVRHYLSIGTHSEVEIAVGSGQLDGLAAADENAAVSLRTVFTRRSDGLSVESISDAALNLDYSEFLPAPRISPVTSFLIFGEQGHSPAGTTVYDAVADYRVEFFDPVETAPAAYIDCELTVGGRDAAHASHIGETDSKAYAGRILAADETLYSDGQGYVRGLEGYDGSGNSARLIARMGHAPVHVHHVCCLLPGELPQHAISLESDFRVTYPILSLGRLSYTAEGAASAQTRATRSRVLSAADDSVQISEYTISSDSPAGEGLRHSTALSDELFDRVTTGCSPRTPGDDSVTGRIHSLDGRTLPHGITPAPGIYIRQGASGPSKILLR